MSQTKNLLRAAGNTRAFLLMLGCVVSLTFSFSASAFTVYDELFFINKPDLTQYGLKKNQIFYESDLFPLGQRSQPNEAAVRAAARRLVASGYPFNEPVQLDIECWEWDTHWTTEAVATDSMNKLIQVIRWFKNEAPQYTKVGYYAAGPNRQYWPAQDPAASSPAFVKWQGSNDFLAPLIAEKGALYPSLYTFYNDRAGWVKYAKANIAEAKRIGGGKPIYPYIWPRYHEAGDMGHIYIDYDFWKLQLQTIKEAGVAGVIIWGGWNAIGGYKEQWTGDWPWWQATRAFLAAQTATTTAPKPPSTTTTSPTTPTTTTTTQTPTTTAPTITTTSPTTPTTTTTQTPTTTAPTTTTTSPTTPTTTTTTQTPTTTTTAPTITTTSPTTPTTTTTQTPTTTAPTTTTTSPTTPTTTQTPTTTAPTTTTTSPTTPTTTAQPATKPASTTSGSSAPASSASSSWLARLMAFVNSWRKRPE